MNENRDFFAIPYLKGVGQIMLQDSPWTGLLFLIGIFFDSPIVGLAALLSVAVGTLTAKTLKFPEENINMGLYGFSATLVGVALTTFFRPEPIIWVAIIVGSALAAMFQHFLISKKFPGFTLPFIVVTWMLTYVFHNVYMVGAPEVETNPLFGILRNQYAVTTLGFGEVIFQASIVAGVLFFIGVFVSSPVAGLYGLAASVVSAAIAVYLKEPSGDITEGLFSFNAVLCAITFAGTRRRDGLYVLLAVILAILIELIMIDFKFSYLTFPFVAACWIVIVIKKMLPESLQ